MLLIEKNMSAIADGKMNCDTVKKLWNGFCLRMCEISFEKGEDCTFRLGNEPLPALGEGKEYALSVSDNGAAIVGKDYGGLMRGFMSFLMKIEYVNKQLIVQPVTEESDYLLGNRMIHICVFPENDLYFIKKLVRLCAVCQYTHIVIEFWGMLRYDCLKELAWPFAFTKAQAKDIVAECRALGMEPIPMFNMFGHATASRVIYGKHVVLDQNPSLQHYFTPDGWAWDITSSEVFELFRAIRAELYEIFGPTEYFHIGFDEAYYYMRREDLRKQVPGFLKKLTEQIVSENRRPMLWMDMILVKGEFPEEYTTLGSTGEAEALMASLAKGSVAVDWQYHVKEAPIQTSLYLKDHGLDVVIAPWLKPENYNACVDTVSENSLYGLMLTTWNTLKQDIHGVLGCAKKCGAKSFIWSVDRLREETATILRKVSFEGNTYADAGCSRVQIDN